MANRTGIDPEMIEYVAATVYPAIKAAYEGKFKNIAKRDYFRAIELLQDYYNGEKVESRVLARYVSKIVYDNADYSLKGSKFKTNLNSNLDKLGIIPGQKGAQTTVEHANPRSCQFDWLVKGKRTKQDIVDFLRLKNKIVIITYAENKLLDQAGLRNTMPYINDIFCRYKEVGIPIIDAQTGVEV